jgi:GT2 family glycosyltransferase
VQRGPAISVVVSTLDRPDLLARALDAIATGTRRPDEIVVVNQGPAEPVEAVAERFRRVGLAVTAVHQRTRGLSASQNLAVATARHPIVAVVDDDCVPAPDWVEVVAATFSGTGAPDLVGGRVLPLPPDGERTVAVSSRTATDRRDLRWPVVPWAVGTGGNFAVRRDRFLAVGGNDERLGTGTAGQGGNDLDLFARLMRSGCAARYEPALVVSHERATPAEFRARRRTYGFGVGAFAGRSARDRDGIALRVLGAWLRMRLRNLAHRRTRRALVDEALVLTGTGAGLLYGFRLAGAWAGRAR